MVGFGHSSIADVPYARRPALGLETLRLREAYQRTNAPVGQPHRVPVHLLALVTAGRSAFAVDFASYPCRPGSLLWVRPGQMLTLPPPKLDATLVLFEPDFPHQPDGGSDARWETSGTYWQPAGEDEEAIVDGISQLEIDYQRVLTGEQIPLDVLRHHLAALLLRVARLEPEGGPGLREADSEVFVRFRREIESRFAASRQVDEYAQTLGCSVRTLTRASLAATGRTAKQLVDDRVALEAKRLLAETEAPVAEIARRLGFTEPTNFGRFFARTVGQSPGQFRAAHRPASTSD